MRHDQSDRIGILFGKCTCQLIWLIVHFFHCCIYLFPRPFTDISPVVYNTGYCCCRYTPALWAISFKVAIFCLYTPFQIRNIPLPLVL